MEEEALEAAKKAEEERQEGLKQIVMEFIARIKV
jgi:hypothetical protein